MYRWVEHTAELELHIDAPSPEAVFEEALLAFGELLTEHSNGTGGEPAAHVVSAAGPDRPTLLAEWLGELAFLAETERFVPTRVDSLRLEADVLDATVSGVQASPPDLVKGVTYHRLEMRERDGGWHATVVLDV